MVQSRIKFLMCKQGSLRKNWENQNLAQFMGTVSFLRLVGMGIRVRIRTCSLVSKHFHLIFFMTGEFPTITL